VKRAGGFAGGREGGGRKGKEVERGEGWEEVGLYYRTVGRGGVEGGDYRGDER